MTQRTVTLEVAKLMTPTFSMRRTTSDGKKHVFSFFGKETFDRAITDSLENIHLVETGKLEVFHLGKWIEIK